MPVDYTTYVDAGDFDKVIAIMTGAISVQESLEITNKDITAYCAQ